MQSLMKQGALRRDSSPQSSRKTLKLVLYGVSAGVLVLGLLVWYLVTRSKAIPQRPRCSCPSGDVCTSSACESSEVCAPVSGSTDGFCRASIACTGPVNGQPCVGGVLQPTSCTHSGDCNRAPQPQYTGAVDARTLAVLSPPTYCAANGTCALGCADDSDCAGGKCISGTCFSGTACVSNADCGNSGTCAARAAKRCAAVCAAAPSPSVCYQACLTPQKWCSQLATKASGAMTACLTAHGCVPTGSNLNPPSMLSNCASAFTACAGTVASPTDAPPSTGDVATLAAACIYSLPDVQNDGQCSVACNPVSGQLDPVGCTAACKDTYLQCMARTQCASNNTCTPPGAG